LVPAERLDSSSSSYKTPIDRIRAKAESKSTGQGSQLAALDRQAKEAPTEKLTEALCMPSRRLSQSTTNPESGENTQPSTQKAQSSSCRLAAKAKAKSENEMPLSYRI
jgi:hypothetical protein